MNGQTTALSTATDMAESTGQQMTAQALRSRLLHSISHDIRTPLTGIIGNSSLLEERMEQLSESRKKDMIARIHNNSIQLLNMIDNLLAVTRMDGEGLSIGASAESVEEVIAEALLKFQSRHPDAQITVKIPQEILIIPMDAFLIEQAIIHLLDNAVVHSQSDAKVDFTVSAAPTEIQFSVRDYGIGLPWDNSSGIPWESIQGTGLALCKIIATAHHGALNSYTHKNGAEFSFTLPREEIATTDENQRGKT